MFLEQAVIKTAGTEIPVLALDHPLIYIIVLLGFALAFWYVLCRWGRRE
jgi:cobalamin biosynthesis protein CbiG